MAKTQTIDVNNMTKDVEIKSSTKNTVLYLKGISSIEDLLSASDVENKSAFFIVSICASE